MHIYIIMTSTIIKAWYITNNGGHLFCHLHDHYRSFELSLSTKNYLGTSPVS